MLSLSTIGMLALVGTILLGPLFYFLFYAHDIFNLPKWSALIYIAGVASGFVFWPPIASITVTLAWILVIGSWLWLLWQIFRQP